MTAYILREDGSRIPLSGAAVSPTVLALGNFDGVHTGHRKLLSETVHAAAELGVLPAVWTFSEHPFPERTKYLCTLDEKCAAFAAIGIRCLFLEEFSRVRDHTPERFVHEQILDTCHALSVVCGFNFRFGKGASGTPELLKTLLSASDVLLTVLPPVAAGNDTVSSTRIRNALADGDLDDVRLCLGIPYSFSLPVTEGKQLGRLLGFPTANQDLPESLAIPCDGVYASYVTLNGISYPAVTNIGFRPTISDKNPIRNAETHIIGYSGDLYGKPLRVCFIRRLRGETHFDSLQALSEQIRTDCAASLAVFSEQSEVLGGTPC